VLNDVLRAMMHSADDLLMTPDEYLGSVPDWCDPAGDLVNDLTPLLEAVPRSDGYADLPARDRAAIEAFSAEFVRTVRSHAPSEVFWSRAGFRAHADWDRLRRAARTLFAQLPEFKVQRLGGQHGQNRPGT
jgi:hypothetical protein